MGTNVTQPGVQLFLCCRTADNAQTYALHRGNCTELFFPPQIASNTNLHASDQASVLNRGTLNEGVLSGVAEVTETVVARHVESTHCAPGTLPGHRLLDIGVYVGPSRFC